MRCKKQELSFTLSEETFAHGIFPKMATLGLLKIMVFWNKGYDVTISVHDVSNKILLRDSCYIADVIM